jgi:UDP-N-acetylglucosamine 4,6-dehydratase
MKIVDLAQAIGPACDLQEVGIRPGEKLHEVLIPFDEARSTLQFENHYTVQPAFSWWKKAEIVEQEGDRGEPITKRDWQYRSNGNERWLSPPELLRLLEQEEARNGELAA